MFFVGESSKQTHFPYSFPQQMANDVRNAASTLPEPESSSGSLSETVENNLGAIGVATCVNFAVLALLMHVFIHRDYLEAVLPNLVMYTGLAVRCTPVREESKPRRDTVQVFSSRPIIGPGSPSHTPTKSRLTPCFPSHLQSEASR